MSELQIEGSRQSEFVMKLPFLRVQGDVLVTGGLKGILPPDDNPLLTLETCSRLERLIINRGAYVLSYYSLPFTVS